MQSTKASQRLTEFQSLSARVAKHLFLTCTLAFALLFLFARAAQGQTTLTSFEDTANLQQDVFYRGTDQHIYMRYYNSQAGSQVQDLTSASGAPVAASGTAVTSLKDIAHNEQHVFFEAANGHIYELYSASNPASWSVLDVTAATGSGGAAVATPITSFYDAANKIRFVFYLGLDQHVHVFYWYGSWFASDATTAAGAASAALGSALTSYKDSTTGLEHVLYEGADQHIHELYSGLNPAVVYTTDTTASSGATLAAGATPLTSFFDNARQQENIFYIGVDQHIHHLFFVTYWRSEDVTALAGATVPSLGSALSSFSDTASNQLHVFYIGVDQRLHQLYYPGTWLTENVTADAGTQIPALNSPLTSFKDDPDNQQHAYFLGADAHFYHLYYSNGWFSQDLTSGAPVPAP